MRRATSLTEAPGAKASATIDCFCSVLHRRRRSGPDNTSTRLIPPSLAPVQITVLAPLLTKTDHPSARKAAANGRLLIVQCSDQTYADSPEEVRRETFTYPESQTIHRIAP